jgi:hypothetical protein
MRCHSERSEESLHFWNQALPRFFVGRRGDLLCGKSMRNSFGFNKASLSKSGDFRLIMGSPTAVNAQNDILAGFFITLLKLKTDLKSQFVTSSSSRRDFHFRLSACRA